MSKNHRSLFIALSIGGSLSVALISVCFYFGVHMNTSGSVAGTFWYEKPLTHLVRGTYVSVCMPEEIAIEYDLGRHVREPGPCSGSAALLKRIVAVSGDHIKINRTGVYVQNTLIENSLPYALDGNGTALPVQSVNRVVPVGYVVVLGDTVTSFDSRYFGLISLDWIESAVARIL